MPKKSHKESRLLFVREAKKLYQKEFLRWYKLTAELKPLLRLFRQVDINIPTLYVMGSEDYMFLPSIEKLAAAHRSAQLSVVPHSGHVVNVDQPDAFNSRSISFIEKLNR
jgi:pimeloyl-ACP methyl ester carboxylesterase